MATQDILTNIFETLRLRSLVSFVANLRPEDAVLVPAEPDVVRFHLVRRGGCTVTVPGLSTPVELERGDLVLIPHGASQVLRGTASEGHDPVPLTVLIDAGCLTDGVLSGGVGPIDASLLCGYFRFDGGADHPILTSLPSAMILRDGARDTDPWTTAALRLLALEADRMGEGAGAILSRSVEIVFVQAVRAAITNLEAESEAPSFLKALADRHLVRALAAMHTMPDAAWTLTQLSKEAGLSRTVFAESFARTVGQPPIGYLAMWRITRAQHFLRHTDLSAEEIAERVGYASPAAFARRFKAETGIGPGAYRRMRRS